MKAKFIIKRVLSTVLVMVMLFSCWVFTAPTAEADNAGSYYIKITGAMEGWKALFVTNSNLNNNFTAGWDSSTNDSCGMVIRYRTNNGTGGQDDQKVNLKGKGWGSVPTSKGTKTADTTVSGFPTGFYFCLDQNDAAGTTYMYITKIEIGASSTSTLHTIWSGEIKLGSTNNTKKAFIYSDGSKSNSSDVSINSNPGWTLPYLKSSPGEFSLSSDTVNLDGTNNKTVTVTGGSNKVDQYGVTYATDNCVVNTVTPERNSDSFSSSGRTITIAPGAHISADNVNSQSVTVTAKWLGSTEKDCTNSPTFTVVDEQYDSTWYYYETNSSNLASPTRKSKTAKIYYGEYYRLVKPTVTNSYYDATNHYTDGDFSIGSPTWANGSVSNKEITMSYTTGTHEGNYAYVSNGHTASSTHSYKCSVCGYVKSTATHNLTGVTYSRDGSNHWKVCSLCNDKINSTAHSFGDTSFSFSNDGKSAMASKTCSVCDYVKTENATVTDSVKTASTCTTKGWTTYTATSPFAGDSASDTKDVQDIPINSSNHNYQNTKLANDTNRVSEADCLNNAVYYKVCLYNNEHLSDETFEDANTSLGHHFPDSWIELSENETYHGNTYNKDLYHKHSCDRTGCSADDKLDKNGKWQTDYSQHIWVEDENGQTKWFSSSDGSKHYRLCSTCGYRNEENHTSVHYTSVPTQPTCTADGFITHTCNTCGYSYTEYPYTESGNEEYKALGHALDGVALTKDDAEGHYKVCARCHENIKSDGTIGKDAHTPASAVRENEVAAGCTAAGSYDSVIYCSNPDCHYEISRTPTVIPALGHNFTDTSVRNETTQKVAPTCMTDGEYYYGCSRCDAISHNIDGMEDMSYTVTTEGETGYRLGHVWGEPISAGVEDTQVEGNAYVYFKCSNAGCDKYCAAEYNETAEEYEAVNDGKSDEGTATSPSSVATDSAKVPTPYFNDGNGALNFYDGLNYSYRPASFRFDSSSETQTMRFAGSVKVPAGVSWEKGSTDADHVIDFGFVYTQTKYICDVKDRKYQAIWNENPIGTEELGYIDCGYYEYSNPDYTKLVYNEDNQTGTNHIGDEGYKIYKMSVYNPDGKTTQVANGFSNHNVGNDIYLTFNLVIGVKADNWEKQYSARPYIEYVYHGETYLVYDNGTSSRNPSGEQIEGKPLYSYRSVMELAEDVMAFSPFDELDISQLKYSYKVKNGHDMTYQIFKNWINQTYRADKEYTENKFFRNGLTDDNELYQMFLDYKYDSEYGWYRADDIDFCFAETTKEEEPEYYKGEDWFNQF